MYQTHPKPVAETKALLNFFVVAFTGWALNLNIRAWLLGDNVNKYLALAVSILAIIGLFVKLLILIENYREKRHNNRIAREEFKKKYGKPPK